MVKENPGRESHVERKQIIRGIAHNITFLFSDVENGPESPKILSNLKNVYAGLYPHSLVGLDDKLAYVQRCAQQIAVEPEILAKIGDKFFITTRPLIDAWLVIREQEAGSPLETGTIAKIKKYRAKPTPENMVEAVYAVQSEYSNDKQSDSLAELAIAIAVLAKYSTIIRNETIGRSHN